MYFDFLLFSRFRLWPTYASAHNNLGESISYKILFIFDRIRFNSNRNLIRKSNKKITKRNSLFANKQNLGTLVNNLDIAENHFLSAILYASSHVNAHFNLGQLYL